MPHFQIWGPNFSEISIDEAWIIAFKNRNLHSSMRFVYVNATSSSKSWNKSPCLASWHLKSKLPKAKCHPCCPLHSSPPVQIHEDIPAKFRTSLRAPGQKQRRNKLCKSSWRQQQVVIVPGLCMVISRSWRSTLHFFLWITICSNLFFTDSCWIFIRKRSHTLQGSLYYQPKQCILNGKSPKMTIYICSVLSPQYGSHEMICGNFPTVSSVSKVSTQ